MLNSGGRDLAVRELKGCPPSGCGYGKICVDGKCKRDRSIPKYKSPSKGERRPSCYLCAVMINIVSPSLYNLTFVCIHSPEPSESPKSKSKSRSQSEGKRPSCYLCAADDIAINSSTPNVISLLCVFILQNPRQNHQTLPNQNRNLDPAVPNLKVSVCQVVTCSPLMTLSPLLYILASSNFHVYSFFRTIRLSQIKIEI